MSIPRVNAADPGRGRRQPKPALQGSAALQARALAEEQQGQDWGGRPGGQRHSHGPCRRGSARPGPGVGHRLGGHPAPPHAHSADPGAGVQTGGPGATAEPWEEAGGSQARGQQLRPVQPRTNLLCGRPGWQAPLTHTAQTGARTEPCTGAWLTKGAGRGGAVRAGASRPRRAPPAQTAGPGAASLQCLHPPRCGSQGPSRPHSSVTDEAPSGTGSDPRGLHGPGLLPASPDGGRRPASPRGDRIAHGQETEGALCAPGQAPAPSTAGSRAGARGAGGARAGTQQAGRGRGMVHRRV